MLWKTATWIVLVAYTLFNCSCMHTVALDYSKYKHGKGDPPEGILSVVTTDGKTIGFLEDHPGNIYGNAIEGTIPDSSQVNISKADVTKEVYVKRGRLSLIGTKNGDEFSVLRTLSGSQDSLSLIVSKHKAVRIPLGNVNTISVRRLDAGKTLLVALGGAVILGFISAAVIASSMSGMTFDMQFN
jgi:hypothetical protein